MIQAPAPVPEIIDSNYLLASYNAFRCGVCGVTWTDHPKDIYCYRYCPPDSLIASLPDLKKKVIIRNLGPDKPGDKPMPERKMGSKD